MKLTGAIVLAASVLGFCGVAHAAGSSITATAGSPRMSGLNGKRAELSVGKGERVLGAAKIQASLEAARPVGRWRVKEGGTGRAKLYRFVSRSNRPENLVHPSAVVAPVIQHSGAHP